MSPIENTTVPVSIDIPPEFFELCERFGKTPQEILRGFIADACELKSYLHSPRADEYCSNGGDESSQAVAYLERAYRKRTQ